MQSLQTELSSIQTPLVSFIIVVDNNPVEHLQECLRSIFQLSLNAKEREIILVDDGSDVCPLDELKEWEEDIIYIRQRRQGKATARNRGLQMATGKFIQFVDGDDHLIRAPYEHCLDIVRYHNPDIVYFEETNKSEVEIPFTYSAPISGSIYLHNNSLRASACSYLFRYSLLINLRFIPGVLQEDEEFTPQLFLRADRVISTSSKAYFYRNKKSSIDTSANKHTKCQQLTDMERIIFRLQEVANTLHGSDRIALNRRIAQLTMDYLYNTIVLTRSYRHLKENIKRMHNRGLYPLPEKNYTKKYHLFRKLINTRIGRIILLLTLPKRKSA